MYEHVLPLRVLQLCGGSHCLSVPCDHWQLWGMVCVGVSMHEYAKTIYRLTFQLVLACVTPKASIVGSPVGCRVILHQRKALHRALRLIRDYRERRTPGPCTIAYGAAEEGVQVPHCWGGSCTNILGCPCHPDDSVPWHHSDDPGGTDHTIIWHLPGWQATGAGPSTSGCRSDWLGRVLRWAAGP